MKRKLYIIKFIKLIKFKLFLIISIGRYCCYSIYRLTKAMGLNNLTQKSVLNLT